MSQYSKSKSLEVSTDQMGRPVTSLLLAPVMTGGQVPPQLVLNGAVEDDVHGQRHVRPPLVATVAAVANAVVHPAPRNEVLQMCFFNFEDCPRADLICSISLHARVRVLSACKKIAILLQWLRLEKV